VEREVFARHLQEAAAEALAFARTLIAEPLPDAMRFRVRLNSSYDGNPLVGGEVVFPEDGTIARALELQACDVDMVVDTLWRDGRVPEWIDVAVFDETGAETLIELTCCGRYSAQEQLLYHAQRGRPPFHPLGPTLPARYEPGRKFSIHHRSECWTPADVRRLRDHASKVWSLCLLGDRFDDGMLAGVPDLANLEILEVRGNALSSAELLALSRFPKLRVLGIGLSEMRDADVDAWLRPVEHLDVLNLAGTPVGDGLAETLPARFGLSDLNLCETRVTADAVRRIRREHPGLTLLSDVE